MGHDQWAYGMRDIPADAYVTGIWEVSAKDEYDAREIVRTYHANRSICLVKQKRLSVFRVCFMVLLMPLFGYFITEFWQEDLDNYMAVISTVYTAFALFCVIFLKNLAIPAAGSLIYSAEALRLDDITAIIPTLVPIVLMCALAFYYERDRRWIGSQPGFPAFHDIEVRVKEARMLTERNVPPPEDPPAEDPYNDILSRLQ